MPQKGFCTFKSKLKVNKTHLCSLKMRKNKVMWRWRKTDFRSNFKFISMFLDAFKSPSPSTSLLEVVVLLTLAAYVIHSPPEDLRDLCKNELRLCCTLLWVSIVFHGVPPFLWALGSTTFFLVSALWSLFLTTIKTACYNPNILNLPVSITL